MKEKAQIDDEFLIQSNCKSSFAISDIQIQVQFDRNIQLIDEDKYEGK